jgi:hypothetical protein
VADDLQYRALVIAAREGSRLVPDPVRHLSMRRLAGRSRRIQPHLRRAHQGDLRSPRPRRAADPRRRTGRLPPAVQPRHRRDTDRPRRISPDHRLQSTLTRSLPPARPCLNSEYSTCPSRPDSAGNDGNDGPAGPGSRGRPVLHRARRGSWFAAALAPSPGQCPPTQVDGPGPASPPALSGYLGGGHGATRGWEER